MRVYAVGENVLANCGTKKQPDWIPGIVISREIGQKPCYVKLTRPSDGSDEWFFPDSFLIQDVKRNRRKHGIAEREES